MKKAVFISILFTTLFYYSGKNKSIDPTGVYLLGNPNDSSYSGEIRVTQLNDDYIIVDFFITSGAPSYNSGAFHDTLQYNGSYAIYSIVNDVGKCRIKFLISNTMLKVEEITDCGCRYEFGNGVYAIGEFYKIK